MSAPSLKRRVELAPVAKRVAMLLEEYDRLSAACRCSILDGLSAAPHPDVLRAHFARGKMLRARLVFAATAAVGAVPTQAMSAAKAIELLHGASLIHDDIVDEASLRRGLSAVHLRVPRGTAIILGDYLVVRAVGALSRATAVDPQNVVHAIAALCDHIEICCCGQVEELTTASGGFDEGDYLELVERKTASQFAAAAQLGPILVGAPDAQIQAVGRYATSIGVAFQIADDLLDLVGDEEALGKPTGNSLARGRPLLPVIYLFEYGTTAGQTRYRTLTSRASPRAAVARLLAEEGMLDRARETQYRFCVQAGHALNALPRSASRDALAYLGRAIASWAG